MATTLTHDQATVGDLMKVEGKAELINERIIHFMPTGDLPATAALEIALSLRLHARATGLSGIAVGDNAGFLCDLPHRKSFSPDAAFYTGPRAGMRYYPEVPVFAVEVRSEGDYGPAMEEELEAKRADYFAAGTLVVWDVDLLSASVVIQKYTKAKGEQTPEATFTRGTHADAEPAVPGWAFLVDDLFAP